MPRDQVGTQAPTQLSKWIDHLKRAKLAAKKGRAVKKRQRALTVRRTAAAECLVSDIVDRSDVIGRGLVPQDYGSEDTFFVLVSLPAYHFRKLCEYGAELEDLEDTNDAEPGHEAEQTLGWHEQISQATLREGSDDGEPSLGSTGMVDQRRWHEGGDRDLELDRSDDEASHGADAPELDCCDLGEPRDYQTVLDRPIVQAARRRYKPQPAPERVGDLTYATVDPETQRAGKWVMLPRSGR
jgi:hypothetical protein